MIDEESVGSVFERLRELWKERKTREKGIYMVGSHVMRFPCTTSTHNVHFLELELLRALIGIPKY